MANLFDNLVFHLKMNDNAASTVVLNAKGPPHGTSVRNTSLMHVPGKIGGALGFNGTSDYVNTNQTFEATFRDSFTISFRCKATDGITGVYQNLFSAHKVSPSNFVEMGIRTDGKFDARYIVNGSAILAIENTPSFVNGANDWKMLTAVITKESATTGNVALYLNGILVKQGTTGNVVFANYNNTNTPCIGVYNRDGDKATEWFTGSLDNIMIFNRALTAEENYMLFASYLAIYRGQDGIMDYDNIVDTMDIGEEEISIFSQDLPPDTIWHYIRRQVSDCGLESPDSPPCIVVIDSDGEMIGSTPNRPVNIIIEQLAGGKLRLRWRYFATAQEIKATGFKIYMDDGGGFDFDEPLIAIPYRGAVEHEWTSDALTHGQRYKFIIRSYALNAGESNNTQYVSAIADSQGPPAATGLILTWQEV